MSTEYLIQPLISKVEINNTQVRVPHYKKSGRGTDRKCINITDKVKQKHRATRTTTGDDATAVKSPADSHVGPAVVPRLGLPVLRAQTDGQLEGRGEHHVGHHTQQTWQRQETGNETRRMPPLPLLATWWQRCVSCVTRCKSWCRKQPSFTSFSCLLILMTVFHLSSVAARDGKQCGTFCKSPQKK